jgi:O-antigen/teichoic acid export membrane protein
LQTKTDIDNTLIAGSKFMLLARLIVKAIGMVSSLILARLLVPEDFGLVAIAMAFLAFIDLFGQFGFGTVLIQKQDASQQDYDTAWTFRVIFGFFAAAVLIICAPALARFYSDPRLTDIIYVLALIAVLGGAQNIKTINFQKFLDFKKELWFQIIPKFLSFLFTLILAWFYRNYWALVAGMVFNQLISVIVSFVMAPSKPVFTLKSFNQLFSFSKWLMMNNIVFFLNTKLTELLIGKYVSTAATGVFSLSNEIASLPMTELAAPINKASYPVYARWAEQRQRLVDAYLSTIQLSALLTIPASCGIYLIAETFVAVVLGDKWLDVAPLMQWIAIASLLFSLSTNNGYIYLATGRPQITFYISLLRVLVLLPLFVLLLDQYGLVGAGYALCATSLLTFVVSQFIIMRFLQLKLRQLLAVFAQPLVAAGTMVLALTAVYDATKAPATLINLMLTIVVGASVYCVVSVLIWLARGRPDGLEKKLVGRIFPV